MERYIALLRGINVSGKNKIAMPALKVGFLELGYTDVLTYLNSGNVVFSSDTDDIALLSATIQTMIKDTFNLDIPVLVIAQAELADILHNAPDWWGDDNKDIYDNLIFMFPGLSYSAFYSAVGQPNEELEKVCNYKQGVFWSFSRKAYQKTNWWSKTASSNVSSQITIRTANTIRKLATM